MRRLLIVIALATTSIATSFPALAVNSPHNGAALLIGIDHHQGRTRSNVGAVGDALDKQQLLRRQGWRDDQIRVLVNQAATQAAIREGMSWLANACAAPDSYCVFHYSGHTKQMKGSEGLNEYMWPHDNRFISDTEFAGFMRRLNGHAWIDIAACEASGFDNGVSSDKRLFTAASQEHEKGYEYPSWQNSVWTGLVVDEGMLQGRGDANGDGYATLAEALQYGKQRAPGMTVGQPTGAQHPYVAGGGENIWFPSPPGHHLSVSAAAPAKRCLLFLCF